MTLFQNPISRVSLSVAILHAGHARYNQATSCEAFHGPHAVRGLSGLTYLEIKKWSCYGEAVARLLGLCVTATAVCAVDADHFVIMMN